MATTHDDYGEDRLGSGDPRDRRGPHRRARQSFRADEIYRRLRQRRHAVGRLRRIALRARAHREDRHRGRARDAGRARRAHRRRHRRALLRLRAQGLAGPRLRARELRRRVRRRGRRRHARASRGRGGRRRRRIRGAAGGVRSRSRDRARRAAVPSRTTRRSSTRSASARRARTATCTATIIARKGDPEAAFAKAERIFEHTFTTPRTHGGYIEPRATLVWIDDAGALHVLSTNKSPFALRDQLAMMTGLPKDKVVIHPSFIGGEFGAKALTIEEFPLYFLAKATNRPVKHVRSHADDVRSTHVRHAAKIRVRFGTKKDGTIQALDVRVLFDGGAYAAGKPVPWLLPGRAPKLPYRIEHAQVERMTVVHQHDSGRLRARAGRHPDALRRRVADRHGRQGARHRSARLPPAQRCGRRAIPTSRATRSPNRARKRCSRPCARNSAGANRCRPGAAAASR